MTISRIAYITPPLEVGAGADNYPLRLARSVLAAAPGQYAITLLSCGPTAREETLGAGLYRRILPVARQSWHPLDALSWELLPALMQADLVHLFQPQTRVGDVSLLLTRLRRIPLCVSVYGPSSSKLFAELELLDLADHVFIVGEGDFEGQAAGAQMHAVYRGLLQEEQRAAA